MSYCRFSCDNFRCDFYAYESKAGFQLHVAASRVEWEPPTSPYTLESLHLTQEEFKQVSAQYHQALMAAPRTYINLPGAGESHQFDTLRELRSAIQEHIALGFLAPDWLIQEIDQEIGQELEEETEQEKTEQEKTQP